MVEKMKLKTYTARWRRVGDWWAISVPELKGINTQSRRLEKAGVMVRDAITLFLDVPADSFDIKIEPILPRDLQ
jgi:predicted RNase H-like HicB family nuclease